MPVWQWRGVFRMGICKVTLWFCDFMIMWLCYCVTVWLCDCVTLLQCYNARLTHSYLTHLRGRIGICYAICIMSVLYTFCIYMCVYQNVPNSTISFVLFYKYDSYHMIVYVFTLFRIQPKLSFYAFLLFFCTKTNEEVLVLSEFL